MIFNQAFEQWRQAPRNAVLAKNSLAAVRTVLLKQYGDIDIEQFTETFCRRLFAGSTEAHEMKVKAAAILVYVLQWGGDQGLCKRPEFSFDIANEPASAAKEQAAAGTGQATQPVAAEPAAGFSHEEAPETDGQQAGPKRKLLRGTPPRRVVKIDPATLEPVQEYPSLRDAAEDAGCLPSNIHRALTNMRTAGGCYWCDPGDVGTFRQRLEKKKFTPHSVRATQAILKRSACVKGADDKEDDRPKSGKEALAAKNAKAGKASDRPLSGDAAVEALKKALDEANQLAAAARKTARPSADTRPPLRLWSDQELYDELARRGWEGELIKKLTLRKDE